MPHFLTTPQLAKKLCVSGACVRQWLGEGRIKPALTLPGGQHLWRPSQKKPKPLPHGPAPR